MNILRLAIPATIIVATTSQSATASVTTIDFEALTVSAYYGKSNLELTDSGTCQNQSCYHESGFVIGAVHQADAPYAHLHKVETDYDEATDTSYYGLAYHADSTGIFIRAEDESAFSLNQLDFLAPIAPANPKKGVNDYWEILGFDSAINPDLSNGDGTHYVNRIAYQTVANGFNGTLAVNIPRQCRGLYVVNRSKR